MYNIFIYLLLLTHLERLVIMYWDSFVLVKKKGKYINIFVTFKIE